MCLPPLPWYDASGFDLPGGLMRRSWSSTLLGNTAAGNYSAKGGGLYSAGTSLYLEGLTVSGNTAR